MIRSNPNKKCKGSGIAKDSGCETLTTEQRRYGLCHKCYIDWLLNTPNGKDKMERSKIRGKKIVDKEDRFKRKMEKETVKNYDAELQKIVNKIVRLIDNGLPCLARGRHANQIHAGHVFSRSSNHTIRFNLHNIHRQSAQSNKFCNEDGLLIEGLISEYGQNYYDFLSELRQTPALSYANHEYNTLYRNACKIYNKMMLDGIVYDTVEKRIEARNNFNLKLNIYALKYCIFKPF